jgi:hypothetical protein
MTCATDIIGLNDPSQGCLSDEAIINIRNILIIVVLIGILGCVFRKKITKFFLKWYEDLSNFYNKIKKLDI